MRAKRRYGYPNRSSLVAMMAINALIAGPLISILFAVFGLTHLKLPLPASVVWLTDHGLHWANLWPLLPGAGIGFGCLWYWLILVGRSRGVPWGGAGVYGVLVALANTLVWGGILGALKGVPLLGVLLGLAMLILLPQLLFAMSLFGVLMGLMNGRAAQLWIERRRGR